MFNWHELNHSNILSWAVTHALSTKQVTEAHERGEDWTNVEINTTINGMPIDGEKFIVDLWQMLQKQFDEAVAEEVNKRFEDVEISLEDLLDEAFSAAKEKLRAN